MSFVLAPELRELLGDLRGHDPPADDTLRRLREMNPNYRITWTHPTPDRVVGGKVSEELFEKGLCLPSGTAMTETDLERIVDTIRNTPRKGGKKFPGIENPAF